MAQTETPVVPEQRMDTRLAAPDLHRAMLTLHGSVTLDPKLRELVNVRASILNGCAYCIQLHSKEALAAGEEVHRLFALAAWEESPFTPRERAALHFADAVTYLADGHVADDIYDEAAEHFDEAELAQLLFAAVSINALNRVAIATRKLPPGPSS